MNCNLRTMFGKIIKRAGLEAWPRLFHNLRASRETELLESFPVHVVAAWMGHDAKVSLKHYAQTTDEHFERAARSASGAESGAPTAQNRAQQVSAGNGSDSHNRNTTPELAGLCASSCESQLIAAIALSGEGGI
jgi:hypothetical protein